MIGYLTCDRCGRRLDWGETCYCSADFPSTTGTRITIPVITTSGDQMLTVAILINGQPIVAKNAINQGKTNESGETAYLTDAGEIVWHDPKEGARSLAKKLLDTIRNDMTK